MPFISTTSYCSLDSKSRLTQDEWDELFALKEAISYLPSSVHPSKMERFSELFKKTLVASEAQTGSDQPSPRS
jgi:hypothetical protein